MQADFKVFLDACVLANIATCDLLLRLAERPRQYMPLWSDGVLLAPKILGEASLPPTSDMPELMAQ